MVCIFCKRNEDDIKKTNAEEIKSIESKMAIIHNKIMTIVEGKTSEALPEMQPNCSGETSRECSNCSQSHSIDDANYYWCEKYSVSFNISKNENIKDRSIKNISRDLIVEFDSLKAKCHELGNMKLWKNEKTGICADCYDLINEIISEVVDQKTSEMKDEIIEEIRDELEYGD
jgi:hypothetical protein